MDEALREGLQPEPPMWEESKRKLHAYLRACGVDDDPSLDGMADKVRRRLVERPAARRDDDPVATAVFEMLTMIDEWLAAEFHIDPFEDRTRLLATRATLFHLNPAGWLTQCLLDEHGLIAPLLEGVLPQPVPPLSGFPMPAQEILRGGLRTRLGGWLRSFGAAGKRP